MLFSNDIDTYFLFCYNFPIINRGEIIMSKGQIIVTIIGAILSSSVLNGIITHILYNNKLKKEMKNKGNDMIAQEIQKSLQFTRNLELELTKQEIYDIENELDDRGSQVNLFDGECIYPYIFNNWETYNQFVDKIHECRNIYEKNLSIKVALNIVFIDRYINQLSLFMSENGGESLLPFWGTIFIFDLQKWQRKIDKLLVKEINKYTYKLESHRSLKWEKLKKNELIDQYQGTILYYLLNGKCKKKDEKRMR